MNPYGFVTVFERINRLEAAPDESDVHEPDKGNAYGQLRIWMVVAAVALIQIATWMLAGGASWRPAFVVPVVTAWLTILLLAALATRRIGSLAATLSAREHEHRATLDEVEQLQTQNAMLDIVARSVDVPLTFQALALRIARLVPCDRVGLALLTENGEEFETYTARVHEDERRTAPRPDVVFKIDRTAIGTVVRSTEPMLVNDMKAAAPEFLDANVLYSAGFRSAVVLPLISRGRSVGTLNVVARREHAFTAAHIEMLRPIAEILAVAHVAQFQQMLLSKYRTIEAMSDVMLSIAAEINSALQTIVGHCDLLERTYTDPDLRRDLATITTQAHRIAALLEKMRTAAHDRLKEVATTIEESKMTRSPADAEEQPFT